MPSFVHIDNTDNFGRISCQEEKKIDINLAYNENNLLTDIDRLSKVPIFIDKEPLENWIKPVINSENNPSKSLSSQEQTHFSLNTILKEKKPELPPEKQQQYAVFLSRFSSQSIFKDYLVYLNACGFVPNDLELKIDIALHKEAIYMQINCGGRPLLLKSNDEVEPRNASNATNKYFEGVTTYKVVLTEVPIEQQNLIQDTSPKNTNRIKIERSLIESKLICLKEYEGNFNPHIEKPVNPPVTANSRLPGFFRFLLDKIISLLKFIKDIFKKNNREKQNTEKQAKEDIDIYSPSINQKEEKVKLDTLYFDPSCNKLARNLEDFPINPSSETTKPDKSDPLSHKKETSALQSISSDDRTKNTWQPTFDETRRALRKQCAVEEPAIGVGCWAKQATHHAVKSWRRGHEALR